MARKKTKESALKEISGVAPQPSTSDEAIAKIKKKRGPTPDAEAFIIEIIFGSTIPCSKF